MSIAPAPWIAALLAVAFLQGAPAKAETFNTCAGFIDALPATITTQGVWCLRKDLTTSITHGEAISIATNNVTIDCNGFKIGGLAAGADSLAAGIRVSHHQNATVRHCAVRGFYIGIFMDGAGHLIEENRLDQNLSYGMVVYGENNRVQRNAVYDTGGSSTSAFSYGIFAYADVVDNTVAGVFATATDTYVYGLYVRGGYEVRGNRVRGLVVAGNGYAKGIYAHFFSGMTIADNRVSSEVATSGVGIHGHGAYTFCTGNTVVNFAKAYQTCAASDGNLALPLVP